ncbi:QRFP-like peptide receptor [Physella acuta]|uniref:QRFP-like peptide receptor n=1 Tax=Physella acuta TaxID=109671 RepID=UPI0027DE4748|nr:QRFP-like peptide receptor [Physella acuta]
MQPTTTQMIKTMQDNSTNTTSVGSLSPPDYMYAYVTILNVIIFAVGVIGNVMVLLVMVRMRIMRTRVNYFLASLSVADLLVLVVCQPIAMLVFYTREVWVLGSFMCKMVPFLEHWTLHASVLTLLLIGFDRYFILCRPQTQICPSHTCLLIIPAWTLSCFLAIPFIFLTHLNLEQHQDGAKEACRTEAGQTHFRIFNVVTFFIMFVAPLFLLLFLYTSVITTLRRLSCTGDVSISGIVNSDESRNGIHHATARNRRQVAQMMVAIVVLFFVCFMPFKILTMWLTFATDDDLASLGFETYYNLLSFSRMVTYINSAGNPVIYAWMSPKFRRAFMLSLPRCRRHSSKIRH